LLAHHAALILEPGTLEIPSRATARSLGARRSPALAHPLAVLLLLALATLSALVVQGYHLGTDDAEIYEPAIKKALNAHLFPFGDEFFMHHAHLSCFPTVVAWSSSLTHVPVDATLFAWYVASLFFLFLAARKLLCLCFEREAARWSGIALLACVLTVPVAGTALILVDPYLTARSFSTPATIFALASFVEHRPSRSLLWLFCTALIHPQMAVYALLFVGCLAAARYQRRPSPVPEPAFALLMAWPMRFELTPAHGAYREILQSRSYFLVSSWQWYEWVGVIAPLLALFYLSRCQPRGTLPACGLLARAMVGLGLLATGVALVLASSTRFDYLARLQPMRSFHLIYVLFFLFLGALAGQYILKNCAWRWTVFLALAAAMCVGQIQAYPASPHIEWPGVSYGSGWLRAFLWIRHNTPDQDIFALDPDYMELPGVDLHGFRALAERSVLPDNAKDSGAVSVFPELADDWKQQTAALRDWKHFTSRDFGILKARYAVKWIVLQRSISAKGLVCPYQNDAVRVCRIAGVPQ